MTADGVLAALHDKPLNRTADAPEGVPERYCRGLVSKKTLEQIKMCDAGSWFSPEYAGEQIPPSRRSSLNTARASTTISRPRIQKRPPVWKKNC